MSDWTILNDVLDLQSYGDLPGFADATPDMVDAILDGAARLAGLAKRIEHLKELQRSAGGGSR